MASVVQTEQGNFGEFLRQLPLKLRAKGLRQAARRGGAVVRKKARELVPVGDPNHRPDNPSLKSTIAVKVVSYQGDRIAVAVVGPRYPQGSHGHLIEKGWEIRKRGKKGQGPGEYTGARVAGKPFMAPAADLTLEEQQQAVVEHLRSLIEEQAIG